jgi:hypothetical protein
MNSIEEEPDSEVRGELRSACKYKAEDIQRVAELLDSGSVTAADATACLEEAWHNLPLMRLLLEHGANPAACATEYHMGESIELIKLLVEFGHDIKTNGHWILQYGNPSSKKVQILPHGWHVLRDYADSQESIDWLLDQGVDINRTDHEYKNDSGRYCLRSLNFSLALLNKVAKRGDIAYFDHLVARGADPNKSLALHSACECDDQQKAAAMIVHLLDVHHMDIEADNEDFRDYFHASPDSGTPLINAVYRQNMPALLALLERGANPKQAIYQSIHHLPGPKSWLPAVGPLLDAGANPDWAFEHAVDNLNFGAARLCLAKGANPTGPLRAMQAKAKEKASGSWDRPWYEPVEGDGGDSEDDDGVKAAGRQEMRNLVQVASDRWMGAQSELLGF